MVKSTKGTNLTNLEEQVQHADTMSLRTNADADSGNIFFPTFNHLRFECYLKRKKPDMLFR